MHIITIITIIARTNPLPCNLCLKLRGRYKQTDRKLALNTFTLFSVYLFPRLSLPVCIYARMLECFSLSVYVSVYLYVCLSVCLYVCLSVYLSVSLSICLSFVPLLPSLPIYSSLSHTRLFHSHPVYRDKMSRQVMWTNRMRRTGRQRSRQRKRHTARDREGQKQQTDSRHLPFEYQTRYQPQ